MLIAIILILRSHPHAMPPPPLTFLFEILKGFLRMLSIHHLQLGEKAHNLGFTIAYAALSLNYMFSCVHLHTRVL